MLLLFASTLGLLSSCNEQGSNISKELKEQNVEVEKPGQKDKEFFELINTNELNKMLSRENKDLSAEDVMKIYYPAKVETGEGNEKIEISEEIATNGNTIVTLIHDNLLDDSVKGEKYLMELKKTEDKWVVISLIKNWKCRNGRGHTDWGIELCR